jgi:hypothetical protein
MALQIGVLSSRHHRIKPVQSSKRRSRLFP